MINNTITILSLIWAGMIFAISFLEAWVKFRAATLTKAVGLDVGRTVFSAFQKVQLFLASMVVLLTVIAHIVVAVWLIVLIIVFSLIIQIFILFPKLNRRADAVIAGKVLEKSSVHAWYGVLEIIKLMGLLSLAVFCLVMI